MPSLRPGTPERHPWLDQHLVPAGQPLRAIATGVAEHLEEHEASAGFRKRARKTADQATFRTLVEIVIANLALAVLHPPASGALAVRLGNVAGSRSRYDHPAFGKQVPQLLATLDATGFAAVDVSTRRGTVSSVTPTATMAALVEAGGVTFRDFGRDPKEECIALSRKLTPREDSSRRQRQEYQDTPFTKAMREQLRRLNAFLEAADVAFVPDGLDPVNDSDRRLTRRFFIGPEESLSCCRFRGHRD